MGTLDLNRIAVGVGKSIKLIADLEIKIHNNSDVYEYKDDLYFVAYICRVSILDRLESNPWIGITTPISVPMGLFKTRKETIYTSLMLTVEKLKRIASLNIGVFQAVESILQKEQFFYEFESALPTNIKSKL